MALVVENVINNRDENYPSYGDVVVSVRNTDTGEVQTACVDYHSTRSEGEATAQAIKQASDKF